MSGVKGSALMPSSWRPPPEHHIAGHAREGPPLEGVRHPGEAALDCLGRDQMEGGEGLLAERSEDGSRPPRRRGRILRLEPRGLPPGPPGAWRSDTAPWPAGAWRLRGPPPRARTRWPDESPPCSSPSRSPPRERGSPCQSRRRARVAGAPPGAPAGAGCTRARPHRNRRNPSSVVSGKRPSFLLKWWATGALP